MAKKYFLGCMTQQGFSTEFGKLIDNTDYYTYILKGGAGTGKSSLMKKIAAEFEDTEDVVRFYCSSDPNSLDAVVLNGSKVIIVDGTAPHVFDPKYPGACQKIINLGENWDEEKLKAHKQEIIEVTDKNKSLLARAKKYQTALSNVCSDSYFCALGCIDNDKLEGFTARLCKKLLTKKGLGSGRQDVRQLTALTEHGCMTRTETLESYIDIYSMADEYYACAHLVIEAIAKEAVKRSFDIVLCPSHAFNNNIYEHLLIPELGVALISYSPLTELSVADAKPINLGRFYKKEQLTRLKTRLKLNKLTAASLADETYDTIKSAKAVHDDIEKYYIEAMSFDKLDDVCDKLIEEIRKR